MRTVPSLRALHPTATDSSHFSPLRSRRHLAPLTSLDATPMDLPASCCKHKTYGTAKSFRCNIYTKLGGYSCQLKGLHESVARTGLPIQVLSFHTLAHSFALTKNSTLLFSIVSALFAQNTRGWGMPTSHENLLFPLARPTMHTASHTARSRHA